ncbi:hypothetical protein EDC01DRAFT_356104 [Geopyxis carbonaria]|nr:hypothetical protein EDC01DRAFT_356104 [Geopyxis carbonaria]
MQKASTSMHCAAISHKARTGTGTGTDQALNSGLARRPTPYCTPLPILHRLYLPILLLYFVVILAGWSQTKRLTLVSAPSLPPVCTAYFPSFLPFFLFLTYPDVTVAGADPRPSTTDAMLGGSDEITRHQEWICEDSVRNNSVVVVVAHLPTRL